MTYASKKEAHDAMNAARAKAQKASEMIRDSASQIDRDAAESHYQRCIRELEEAINDAAPFETSGDDE